MREHAAQLYAALLARGTQLYEAEYRRTRLDGGATPGDGKPGGGKPGGGKPGDGASARSSGSSEACGASGGFAFDIGDAIVVHNYEPAIAAFKEAVALDSAHPAAHFALAVAYKAYKRPALAALAACDAVERCTDYSGTWADAVEICFACYRELTAAEAAQTLYGRAWWWTDEVLLQFSRHAVVCNADEPRAWVMRAEVLCALFGEASWPGQRQPRAAKDYREAAAAFATAAKLTRPADAARRQRLLAARQRCLRLELAPPPLTPTQRRQVYPLEAEEAEATAGPAAAPAAAQRQRQRQRHTQTQTQQAGHGRDARRLGEASAAVASSSSCRSVCSSSTTATTATTATATTTTVFSRSSSASSSASRSLPRVGSDLGPMTVVEVEEEGDDDDYQGQGSVSGRGSRTTSAEDLFAINESSSYQFSVGQSL